MDLKRGMEKALKSVIEGSKSEQEDQNADRDRPSGHHLCQ